MRFHIFHLWKYFAEHLRVCRICGEVQMQSNFHIFKKEYGGHDWVSENGKNLSYLIEMATSHDALEKKNKIKDQLEEMEAKKILAKGRKQALLFLADKSRKTK